MTRVYEGDCRDVLPQLAPVDVVITDPPYGETSFQWDKRVSWLELVRPLLLPHGSIWFFTSLKYLLSVDLAGWNVAQEIVWEKHNGSSFHNDRFRRVHELAVQLYPAGVKWSQIYKRPVFTRDATARTVRPVRRKPPPHFVAIGAGVYSISQVGGPRLARSVMKVRSCHGRAVHPTEKPEEIVRPLIEYSCAPGGTVLDPFAGSGAVLSAAAKLGRRAIGIELNPAYIELSKARLAA